LQEKVAICHREIANFVPLAVGFFVTIMNLSVSRPFSGMTNAAKGGIPAMRARAVFQRCISARPYEQQSLSKDS